MKLESGHAAVNELLPWHATGTLSPTEREMVEAHLEGCRACREELEWLREVGIATREYAADMPPVPDMLPKTLAAIDEWERARAPEESGWLTGFLNQLWNPPVPVARVALAAQFVLILALGSLWLVSRPADPGFETLSGDGGVPGGARLTVIFRPDTTEEAMRQTFLGLNGNIVSGPSAIGVYVVEVPVDETDTEAVDAVIEALRNTSTVVDFVERQP